MGWAEISELERLANQCELVSPIKYDENSKDSFIHGIQEWSEKRGTPVSERIISIPEGLSKGIKQVGACILNLDGCMEGLGTLTRLYYIIAPLTQIPTIPLVGVWFYNPKSREVGRGSDLQRYIVPLFSWSDLLVHEYLHAYAHLLYDHLYHQGLILKDYPRPAHVVEAPLFGFYLRPPSYERLRRFERRIIQKLISYCDKTLPIN